MIRITNKRRFEMAIPVYCWVKGDGGADSNREGSKEQLCTTAMK